MFHLVSTSQEDPRTMQRTLQTNTHAPQQWLLVLWLEEAESSSQPYPQQRLRPMCLHIYNSSDHS
ncbi:hypothetical protein NC653_021383 [Populus alba x Populus x berolinensis]|uniref:Uncharacterized protein n=1 Tax=Populus alba x Populus x berolinensis TaxID=444605 RepID=A0AAD6QEM1_9ROSI|nr:hypothetical protein NC653_021383 [Populus alba x Populus x berolinensis]